MTEPDRPAPAGAKLGLWDTASLTVGIIVGVGIYFLPAIVFRNTPSPGIAMLLWAVGGLLSFLGALCFAELASTYPRSGGEYVYLSKAFGGWAGFLFAWAQLTVNRPGATIGVLAHASALFAARVLDLSGQWTLIALASSLIALLTAVNIVGVRLGKRTQNTLTAVKILAVGAVLVAGLLFPWVPEGAGTPTPNVATSGAAQGPTSPDLILATIFVLWTYSGWHEAAYVVAEIQDQRRTIPLALMLGTGLVTLLYLAINLAYWNGLGFERAGRSDAIAAEVLHPLFGEAGARVMAALVTVSALGALHGSIFTSSRIYTVVGADHPLFAPLAHWDPRLGTPVLSLLAQGVMSIAFVVGLGTLFPGEKPFETLVECTAAVFWLFFFLTGVALFVLRWRDPDAPRPFRTPGYPLTPLLFCAFSAFMAYRSFIYSPLLSLVGLGLVCSGLPMLLVSRALGRKQSPTPTTGDSR